MKNGISGYYILQKNGISQKNESLNTVSSLIIEKNKKLKNICHCQRTSVIYCISICYIFATLTATLKIGLRPHHLGAF